jgi:hypothetical protein
MSRAPRTLLFASAAFLSILLFAPVAQADVTFTMPGSGTLEGQRTGSDEFVVHGIGMACDELVYSGEAEGGSRVLEVLPEHAECTAEALSGLPADFYQELCAYRLHDVERMESGERWKANVDIKCSGGYTDIGWDIFETEKRHFESQQVCSTRIPEQAAGTAELRNLDGRRSGIEVRWNLPHLEYTLYTPRGNGFSLFCGSMLGGTRRDAHYSGAARLFAKNPAGRPGQLSLSG